MPGAEPDAHYCYDNFDRLIDSGEGGTSCTTGRTVKNIYDQLGSITKQTTALGDVDYLYDTAGRRTQMTWPDGFYASYAYDNTSALTDICENTLAASCASAAPNNLVSYGFDDLGRLDLVNWGNSPTTDYAFDGLSRLTSLAHQGLGADSLTLSISGYNPASQIMGRGFSQSGYSWTDPSSVSDSYTPPRARRRAIVNRPVIG